MVLNLAVFRGRFHFKNFNVLTSSSEDSVFLDLYTKTLVVLQVCFMSMYTLWYKCLCSHSFRRAFQRECKGDVPVILLVLTKFVQSADLTGPGSICPPGIIEQVPAGCVGG